jgi:hypothetical protein
MFRPCIVAVSIACGGTALLGEAASLAVRDSEGLRAACAAAGPGTVITLAPGNYQPGVFIANMSGAPGRPIVIAGADPANPPVFVGGQEGLHFTSCSHLVLRDLLIRGQKDNGLNIDDGQPGSGSAHHVLVENVKVEDVGPQGNHDGFKFSGLDDFVVRGCTVHGWGGQAIDMVGCHRGLIEGCTFKGKPGFSQANGPLAKGGSREITIRGCRFERAGDRCTQAGGWTDDPCFRPLNATAEAADITIEGCTFQGGEAPVTFAGVDGAVFRFNTVYDPDKWFMRILQEKTDPRLTHCQDGRVERNLFVFNSAKMDGVNVSANTKPETFTFTDNFWFAMDNPANSRPRLPVAEQGGVHGVDPRFDAPNDGSFKPLNPEAAGYGATAFKPPPEAAAHGTE